MIRLMILDFILSVHILRLYVLLFNVIEISLISLPRCVSSFFLLIASIVLFIRSNSIVWLEVSIFLDDWRTQDLRHVTSWMMITRLVFDLFIIKCDILINLPIGFYLHMLLLWNHLSCLLVDNMLLMVILFVELSMGELKLNQ